MPNLRTVQRLAATLTVTTLTASGCAALAVSQNDLEARTAFALGLERGQFTIADRTDQGFRTDYTVTTKTGAVYRCYVGGGLTVIGSVVSDAVCSQSGRGVVAGPCNPLLKAAGKC